MSGHKPWPPAYKKDTPISDRTDESLVRTIAAWMGLDAKEWCSNRALALNPKTDRDQYWFVPNLDSTDGAADRERVTIKASEDGISISLFNDRVESDYDFSSHGRSAPSGDMVRYGTQKTLGRAFIEVIVMAIEAKESSP